MTKSQGWKMTDKNPFNTNNWYSSINTIFTWQQNHAMYIL